MTKATTKTIASLGLVLGCSASLFVLPDTVSAQTAVTITPTQGQTAAQIDADKAECTTIAQQSASSASRRSSRRSARA